MDRKSTVLGMENRKPTVMLNGKAIREDNWNMYALMYLDLVVSWCDIIAYHGTAVRYMSGTGILTVLHVKPETIGLRAIPYLEANNHYTIGYNLLPSETLIARTTKTKWLGDSLLTSILKSTDYIHEHRLCDWSKLCPIHAQPSPPSRPPPPLRKQAE